MQRREPVSLPAAEDSQSTDGEEFIHTIDHQKVGNRDRNLQNLTNTLKLAKAHRADENPRPDEIDG
ncbi:MAG: hypothetical protein R3F19_28380 [Verrucomicrobiales bacterium]